jgi:3-dehydroquinate synthase
MDFYERLTSVKTFIPCADIGKFIRAGLTTKKRIIEEDEFEGGLRRILNYGHTFGHALEAYTHNEIPHGKGVIWGIDAVNFIAVRENLISRDWYLSVKAFIKKNFLREEIVIGDPAALFRIIATDKKVRGNVIHFAVPDNPGHLIVHPLDIDERLESTFKEYLNETHEYYSD